MHRAEVDFCFGPELVVLGDRHLDVVDPQAPLGGPHVIAHGGLGHLRRHAPPPGAPRPAGRCGAAFVGRLDPPPASRR